MITQETKLKIDGKTYTMEEFIARYELNDMNQAIKMANILVKQGTATVSIKDAKIDKIAKAVEREEIHEVVNAINTEEQAYRQAKRNEKAQEVDLVSIGLNFRTTIEATQAEQWINSLGVKDTEISIKSGKIMLKVQNITPGEYNKIVRKYQVENVLRNGVELTGKALDSFTGAINYTATNVVAPVAKLATEAGMNIGKGLVHTGVKIGAGLVNSGAKAIEETSVAMATDPELLRAQEQLKATKDTVMRFFRKKLDKNGGKGGVEIL